MKKIMALSLLIVACNISLTMDKNSEYKDISLRAVLFSDKSTQCDSIDSHPSVLTDSKLKNNQHNHDDQPRRQRSWGQFIENHIPLPVAAVGWVAYHIITGKGENQ